MQEYKVIRKKVKNARIKVDTALNVTVVIPLNYPTERLDKLIREKSHWINKTITRLRENIRTIVLSANEVLLFGEVYRFELDSKLNNRILTFKDSKVIRSDRMLTTNAELLIKWYRHLAAKFIPQRIKELAVQHGFSFNRFFIRNQRTKWGTCSSNRNISLNWRMILCPPEVTDYLIIHELSHLKEMNHSASFWNEVKRICPEFNKSKKWLREHEAFLFTY